MQNERQYTNGSLFSGIGGIELGFEREGFKTIFFVEKDKYCQAVLKQQFNIRGYKGFQCDVITFGFPCQDISQAGKGAGIEGERSGLWKDGCETIRLLRPKIAVIENVPALTRRGLNVVLADLAKIGYDAEWFTLRAQDVGAIHKRERLFVVAYSHSFRQSYGNYLERENKKSSVHNQDWKSQKENKRKGEQKHGTFPNTPIFITNDWSKRIQRFKQETLQGKQGFSWCKDVRRVEDLRNRRDIPEPLFCGSRDGIPFWMDRIKSCGNAVVPQVAQFIARRVKEMLNYDDGGTNFTKSSADDFPTESLISVKRESADSPNSPHDSSAIKEEANFS